MRNDPTGQPLGGATYRGFSAPQPRGGAAPPSSADLSTPRSAPRPPLTGRRAALVGGGVLAALALGVGLGFLAKPDLAPLPDDTPMRPVPGATPLSVQVNPPTAPAPVKAAGKLEVLPPDMAQAAAQATRTYSARDATLRWDAPETGSAPLISPPVRAPQVVAPPIAAPPIPSPSATSPPVTSAPISQARYLGAGPACAGAASRAAQMVCADPDLAAADRELNQAYRRALRSGAPTEQLRQDQRDWLAIREDAARRSPRALANVYEQRIDELNEVADDAPG